MEPGTAGIPMKKHLALLRGRIRRLYLGVLRTRYIRESLSRRVGECLRCGACCRLGVRCPLLHANGAHAECRFYGKHRPPNCRNFPIDERDLADRDLIAPHQRCGFHFNGKGHETKA